MITYKINQAVVCPYLIRDGKFFGGIVDKDIPDIAKIKRGNSFVSVPPEEVCSPQKILYGKYFWGRMLINHFGHILTESIHRLYAYGDDFYDGVLFSSAWFNESGIKNITIPEFLIQICNLFGIPCNKIIIVKYPVVVEQLNFVEAGANLNDQAKNWYFAKLQIIQKKAIERTTLNVFPKKIFLGRSHIVKQGSLMGESYFWFHLMKNGFIYVKPEMYNIFDQVGLLDNAEQIVLMEGSSIYAMELMASLKAKVYLIPRRNNDSSFRPHILPKCEYEVLGNIHQVIRLPNHRNIIGPNSPSIHIDPKGVFDDLIKNKLIKTDVVFNYNFFIKAEYNDVMKYANGNLSVVQNIIDGVKNMRDSEYSKLYGYIEKFDQYVSFGENCEAAFNFRRILNKDIAYYFNWCVTPIKSLLEIIENDFEGTFLKENLYAKSEQTSLITDRKYDISYHSPLRKVLGRDVSSVEFDDLYRDHYSKIKLFIDRFYALCNSNLRVLYFLKTSENSVDAKEKSIMVRDLLLKKFPKHNFEIIVIQERKNFQTPWGTPRIRNRYIDKFAPVTNVPDSHVESWDKIFQEFMLNDGAMNSVIATKS